MMPVIPPTTKVEMKPSAKSIGVCSRTLPWYIVAIHEKILMPVGTAISMVLAAKNEAAIGPNPVVNMW